MHYGIFSLLFVHYLEKTDSVHCTGQNNGVVTLTTHGGTGPYTYSRNDFVTTHAENVFSGLNVGDYTFRVRDTRGCEQSVSMTMNEPSALILNYATTDPIHCVGGADGVVTLTANGGNVAEGPYEYSKDSYYDYQASNVFTGLAAGNHFFRVRDARGCEQEVSMTMFDPIGVVLSAVESDAVHCYGENNGEVTLTATGGNGNYQYRNGNGAWQGSNIFAGLTAGSYTFAVKDGNECENTASVTVTEPAALTLSGVESHTDDQVGQSNGEITLTAAGGNGNFQYKLGIGAWQTSNVFSNLSTGTYTLAVKDARECAATTSVVVYETLRLQAVLSDAVHCYGEANGAVTLTATGGDNRVYEFMKANSSNDPNTHYNYQASNTFTGLAAGTYTFRVKDARGDTASTTITVTEPARLTLSGVESDPVHCSGQSNGEVTLTTAGGNSTFQYRVDNGAYQSSNVIGGLAAGTHTFKVKDERNCEATTSVIVFEPSPLTLSGQSNAPNVVSLYASNGNGSYQYRFDNGTYQTSNTFSGIPAGTYTFTVKDARDCEATVNVTVSGSNVLMLSGEALEVRCHGGNEGVVILNAFGGNGSRYQYRNGNGVWQDSGYFYGLMAGTYTFEVKDADGNTATTSITVTEPNALTLSGTETSGGTATLTATGGISGYFRYKNGSNDWQNSNVFEGLSAGSYTFTVRDARGCEATTNVTITNTTGGGDNPGGDNPGGDNPGGDNPQPQGGDTVIVQIHDTIYVPVHDTIVVGGGTQVTVHDTITLTNTVHDTITVTNTIHDTIVVGDGTHVTVHDTVTLTNTVHDTITVTNTIHDTIVVGDGTHVTVHDTVYADTMYVSTIVHDTVTLTNTIHDTIVVGDGTHVTVRDTVYADTMYVSTIVHDTVTLTNMVHDTITVTNTVRDTLYADTMYVTHTQHDTITNIVYDTITFAADTIVITRTDTHYVTATVFVPDTHWRNVYIHDTICPNVGVMSPTLDPSMRIYTAEHQVVVEGAEGLPVALYDMQGRRLHYTTAEYGTLLRLPVPSTGVYMVRIGDYAAQRVVVMR